MTALASLADALPYGVFLLDGDGRATFCSRQARRMLAEADGLVLRDGVLRVARRVDEAHFEKLVAAAHSHGPEHPAPHVMALARPSGRRPYGIFVIPVAAGQRPADPALAVVVSDPERRPARDEGVLRHLFGFTHREAALVSLLVDGRTLQQAAAEQSMATRTARVHLRSVFQKTGACRQSDLIRIVCLSVAALISMAETGAAEATGRRGEAPDYVTAAGSRSP